MMSKQIRLNNGGVERVTTDVELEHPHRAPSTQPASSVPMEEESDHPSSSTQRKLARPIDVVEDVMRRIKKEMGMFKFVPLSTGRLQDLWWTPTQLDLIEKSRGATGQPSMNLHCQILMDSCPNMMNPYAKHMEVVFRTDINEVLKLSYLFDSVLRELHSEKRLTYNSWLRLQRQMQRYSDEDLTASFAKKVTDGVLSQACTRVPNTFKVFFCKKPTSSYIFPAGCIQGENRNSIGATASTGFKYEYRSRIFIVDVLEIEDIDDDATPPASLDPSL